MVGKSEATDDGAGPDVGSVVGAGGLEISLADHGGPAGAPALVLVHGYPDDRHVWDLVVPELVGDHRVFSYDVRGAGSSGTPSSTAGFAMENLIGDLVAVLDEVSPDRPVHLVGHDWGSIQSWSAILDPEVASRVASFTSMSGPPLEHAARWFAERRRPGDGRWTQMLGQGARSWYIGAFHTPLAPLAWRKGLARRWPAMMRRSEGARTDRDWPGPNLGEDAAVGVGLYRANMFGKLRDTAPRRTEVPVQLVVSAGDAFVAPALLDGIEDLAPDLIRAEIDAKHWIPRSHPERVAELIAEHVARVEAR